MRNNHWKFRKNRAPRGLSFAILRSQKKRRISDRTAARTHHTPGFWYRGIATRVIPGSPAAYMGFRHWSGRFRFISTRTAIGRPRGYRLFAFCPRNDVLRVSAYMQPSDRAWQIGFAGVCMCIVEPQAHCYTRVATYTFTRTGSDRPKLEDTSRGVWSYLHRKWVSATQLSLESRKGYTCIYTPFLLAPSTNRRSSNGGSRIT